MRPIRTLVPLVATALFGAIHLAASVGCRASGGEVPATKTVFAGITYDTAVPLDVKTTKMGGEASRIWAVKYVGGDGQIVPGVLTLPPATTPGPYPCVLLLHGLGGKKEDLFLGGMALANKGYASLAIDIAGHGERPRIGGKPVADLTLPEMHTAVAQTVVDLRRAVDLLAARPDIDAKRIGYLGISLGGIIGGTFVAEEPRIKTATLWAAGGDWGKLITTTQHPFASKLKASTTADAIEATMADVDPARRIARVSPRPLLFINGDKDQIVPRVCTEALFSAAKEPKRLDYLPGGHVPDLAEMLRRTAIWFDEKLKK